MNTLHVVNLVNYYTESVEVLATVVLNCNIPWQSDYSIHCVSSCRPKREPDSMTTANKE